MAKQMHEVNPRKVGRPRKFETPQELWDAAQEYFKWAMDNPLMSAEVVKGGNNAGTLYEVPKMRATTWEGLEVHCGVDLKNYREDKLKDGSKFIPIIRALDKIIFAYNYEGATAELLNPNLVARKLGLKEKVEQSGDMSMNVTVTRNVVKGGSKS